MDTQKPDQPIPRTQAKAPLPFPIVGIGASAGGFPALASLLQGLPPSPGLALVIVLHVPANQQSHADRILQRSTRLPVVQVNHSMPILPDQVYVIPPARSLKMEDGHLVLRELDRTPGDPATIDVFFRTLALAHREKAIGVILSGMGSDGTAGLACIKEQGGVTLVQSPDDAEQSSMPRSAIDFGTADFVLAAADIAAKLVELRGITDAIREHALHGHPPAEVSFDMGPDPERTLRDVLSLLHKHTGHDFRRYRHGTLLRRLERRLQVTGQPDLPSYHALQRRDASESHALLKELLIGVTRFFRDRQAFAALEHTILPRIFDAREPHDTVRVWVAACSTGEEAYSLAMLLADHAASMADPPAFQVFASDIDAQAIRTARAGLYPASIAEDVPPERLQRYFTIENGSYKVRKTLRRLVLFAEHNLLHDPAFSSVDLVSCRNFLIYVNSDVHRQVLSTFHFALRPEGYLMLGCAETVDGASDKFVAVNASMKLYRAKPESGPRPRAFHPAAAVPTPPVQVAHAPAGPIGRKAVPQIEPGSRNRARLFSFAEIHLHKAAEQAPPSILVNGNGEVVHIAEQATRLLRHAGGEPTRDLVSLVHPAWRLALRTALFQAQKSGRQAATGAVRYEQDGEQRTIDISVLPFHDEHAEGLLMLVSFRELLGMPVAIAPADVRDQPLLERLDEEFRHTRNQLLETIDQAEQSDAALRTTVEELKTSIEELHSANSQLQVTLEKALAANGELQTANAGLAQRLESLGKSHDDLNNLIASSDVATLFLDRQMRIQRYTPRIASLFNVIPADVGRPLRHITSLLEKAHLAEEAARVFETLQPLEQEVRGKDGRDYIVRVHPYRTGSHRIDGAVMTFFDITSRRIAEKALLDSEQRLTLAFAALPVGICTVDTAGNTVMLNDVMRRFLPTGRIPSRDPEEGPRWRAWDAGGAPVRTHDFPGARALRGEAVVPGMQMLYLAKDGKETWTEVRAQPLRDSEGGITGALVVVIDVDRLKRSEEKYRALFNEMDEAYAVVEVLADGDGNWNDFLFHDANPAFMRHTGMPYPVGRTATQLLGTPNPQWAALYGRAVETGEPIRVEESELTLGRVFDLNIFRLGGEGSRRVAVLFRDVTDERRTQEALRRSEERYRMLFEASPLPFIVTRPEPPRFTVIGVNDAYLGTTGRTRESLVGRDFFEAFPDNPGHGISSVLRASFERVLATRQKEMLPVMRYDMMGPDGAFEERWWLPLQSPVLDDEGQVEAIIHSATDVTDIHRAGVALRASEERQAFLLKLSDAVRPLTSVAEIQAVTNRSIGAYLGVDRVMFAEVGGAPGAETGFIRTQYVRPAEAGRASLAPFPERFVYRSFGARVMEMRYRGDLIVVTDIDAGPDFMASERAAWASAGVRAAIVVPLARGGRLLAEFGVQSAAPRDWTEAEVSLVRDVGERTLAAVERAYTAEALQESEARFRALAEASRR